MQNPRAWIAGSISALVGFAASIGLLSAIVPSTPDIPPDSQTLSAPAPTPAPSVPDASDPPDAPQTPPSDASDPPDTATPPDTLTSTPTDAPNENPTADASDENPDTNAPDAPDENPDEPEIQLGMPGLKIDVEDISGGYNRKQVFKQIAKKQDDLLKCYAEAQEDAADDKDPPLPPGFVVVHWTIDSVGKVTRADALESSIKKKSLEKCLIKEIKDWKFSAPGAKKFVGVKMRLSFGE